MSPFLQWTIRELWVVCLRTLFIMVVYLKVQEGTRLQDDMRWVMTIPLINLKYSHFSVFRFIYGRITLTLFIMNMINIIIAQFGLVLLFHFYFKVKTLHHIRCLFLSEKV